MRAAGDPDGRHRRRAAARAARLWHVRLTLSLAPAWRAEVDGRGPEGLSTDSPCWQIAIRPEGVEAEDADDTPSACAPPPRAERCSAARRLLTRPARRAVLLSLTFAHTPKYPEEAPLLRVRRCAPRAETPPQGALR